jgi:hypothetical protein
MSSQIDLDINNYDLEELFAIFKIENKYKVRENTIKIKSRIEKIKDKYPEEIVSFYEKAKNILLTIYQLRNENFLDDLEDDHNIYFYMDKLKRMSDVEVHDVDKLVLLLTQKPTQKTYNNISKDTQDDLNILDNPLNEKYPNVSGRVNPNLNNRNNTNIVQSTFSNEIAPGYLNSIKRIIQTQNLNLNSCFRSNYYTSNPCDFLYILPSEIKNVVSMRLASIEIPNAWYLFSSSKKNNIFKIEISVNKNEKEEFTIIIPSGNYDYESLENYLNETYFYKSTSEEETLLKYIKFSINEYNLKSSFEILLEEDDDDVEISFSLHFMEDINQNIMNTFGWAIGFRLGNYLNINGKITSEGLYDGGGDRYIYVSINDYQYNDNNFNTVCFDKSILNEDVIAKIPMVNGKLCLIIDDVDNPLTKTRRYNGPVNIARLQIKILDKFGCIIDLNHMDFSFTLELEVLYESFNFKNVTS